MSTMRCSGKMTGSMRLNYPLNMTVEFDSGSGYETPGTEIVNTTYTFPEGEDGTIRINGHCNRVVSDCLMWYDVSADVNSSSVTARVQTAGTQLFNGRVKVIMLVAAYDGDLDPIHYRVNQGHDTDSYVADDEGYSYIEETCFSTSEVSFLTTIYPGNFNESYAFNNILLAWNSSGPGPYFGCQSRDVTRYITDRDSTMTFDRDLTDPGSYSGYFKIPLTLLNVEE